MIISHPDGIGTHRHRDLKEIRYFFSVFPACPVQCEAYFTGVVSVREKIILKIVLNHRLLSKYVRTMFFHNDKQDPILNISSISC